MRLRLGLTYPESVAWFMLLWLFNTGRDAVRELWTKVTWQIALNRVTGVWAQCQMERECSLSSTFCFLFLFFPIRQE